MKTDSLDVISPDAPLAQYNLVAAPDLNIISESTAKHLLELGLVDEIVPEPLGGAHTDSVKTAGTLRDTVLKHLEALLKLPAVERLKQRYKKFRAFGHFNEKGNGAAERAEA